MNSGYKNDMGNKEKGSPSLGKNPSLYLANNGIKIQS